MADDEDGWAASLQIDLMAAVRASRLALPWLRASSDACILNLSSIAAQQPRPGGAPYAAAKAALSHYTTSQALALARDRIRVNAIAPGSIAFDDGLWDRRRTEDPALYHGTLAKIPFGRFGHPRDCRRRPVPVLAAGALGHRQRAQRGWRPGVDGLTPALR